MAISQIVAFTISLLSLGGLAEIAWAVSHQSAAVSQDSDEANQQKGDQGSTKPKSHEMASEIFSRKISLNAENISLKELLDHVSATANIPIELDLDALQKAKVDLDRIYNASISDTDLSTVIQTIFARQNPFLVMPSLIWKGNALFVTTFAANHERIRNALPDWLLKGFDQHMLSVTLDDEQHVISLSVHDRLSDEMLAQLPTLTMLRQLEISGAPDFTTAGLSNLGQLTSLERLRLSIGSDSAIETKLGDAVLKSVAGLKSLRQLEVVECGITDDGIRQFNDLAQLSSLRIYQEGRLTDSALLSISRHKHLKSLDLTSYVGTVKLGRMHFTQEGTRRLTRLRELENLNLTGHDFSPEILTFPKLKSLTIGGSEFGKPLANEIVNCPELTNLDLSFHQITSDAFEPLAGLSSLSGLNVRCRVISDEAISHLPRWSHLNTLRLWTSGLTDESLVQISKIKALSNLSTNWAANNFSLDGLKQLDRSLAMNTLELRIIPMSGGFIGISDPEPEPSQIISIVLSPAPVRPIVSDSDRKKIPFDLEQLVDALPRTQVVITYDEFNAGGK